MIREQVHTQATNCLVYTGTNIYTCTTHSYMVTPREILVDSPLPTAIIA